MIKFLLLLVSSVVILEGLADNLALGKKYTLEPIPNYQLCSGDSDFTDLTDGKYSRTGLPIWTEKGTVGWAHRPGVTKIILDLGKPQTFFQVRFASAGNTAGVTWPEIIDVEVSNDGKNFYTLGCLTALSKNRPPAVDAGYKTLVYDAEFPAVTARYVRFRCLPSGPYLFCEEIEVIGGNGSELVPIQTLPPVLPDPEFQKRSNERIVESCVKRRLEKDLQEIVRKLSEISLTPEEKEKLFQTIGKCQDKVKQWRFSGNPTEFRSVLPLNSLHREIFRLQSEWLCRNGYRGLTLWTQNRFTNLSPLAVPPRSRRPLELKTTMMNGEIRGAVLNLTNADTHPAMVTFSLDKLPAELFQVEFLDTAAGVITSTVLVPLPGSMEVPAGMTRQLYLRFHPQSLEPGIHQAPLLVTWNEQTETVPVTLNISSISFPKHPLIACGMWDYLAFGNNPAGKSRGIYGDQAGMARKLQQNYLIDSTFAEGGIGKVNRPASIQIDEKGNLIPELDFSLFDRWVKTWPDARYYIIFVNVTAKTGFGGAQPGTSLFQQAVRNWAKQWEKHLEQTGINPGRVIFQLLDEPRDTVTYQITRQWLEAVKSGSRKIKTYSNPLKLTSEYLPCLDQADIICPLLDLLLQDRTGQIVDMIGQLTKTGKELWFYSCQAGPFSTSPWYYRRQPWAAFHYGGNGSFFWALGDSSGVSGWNQYLSKTVYYAPIIIERHTFISTKHLEAIREGNSDFEYLHMLKRFAGNSDMKKRTAARQALQQSLQAVMRQQVKALDGTQDPAESQRLVILRTIEQLSKN